MSQWIIVMSLMIAITWKDFLATLQFRTVFLIVLVAIEYFLFKKAISPALFGEHPWWHQQDLVFNFTIAIIILTHHWFNGRLGFLKEQSPSTA